jgi:hypothetical protein
MSRRIFSLVAVLSLVLTSCYVEPDQPCIRPAGRIYEETRVTSSFHSVSVSVNAEVYVDYAPYYSVVIVAAGNILDEIITSTYGRTLHIDYDHCMITRSSDIEIFITTPELSSVKQHSPGNIYVEGFEGERTTVELSSSGNIYFSGMDFGKVHSILSGSGTIRLSGLTYDHVVQISGSGTVSSFDLFAQEALVQISGSGDARVHVFRYLDARISGSGRVFYKGNPRVQAIITGSGSVIRSY